MSDKKLFFYGLNELRALAALLVIFHHIELFKKSDHINSLVDSFYFSYFIERIGKNGVFLFFVLSGFLITYLLLHEKEKLKRISLKKFYFRRIYRIWPLYYVTLVIGFILVPFLAKSFSIFENTPYFFSVISDADNYSLKSIFLYVFFLPNIALHHFNILLVGCSQAWSVGVEEQFYIVWPILVFYFARKKLLLLFVFLLLSFICVNVFYNFHDLFNTFKIIQKIISLFPFEYMAIGAIGGYALFYNANEINEITKNKILYFLLIILILGFIFLSVFSIYIQSVIISILFLFLILFTINKDSKYRMRNKYLSYLGKISYGIYMYHPSIMFLVFPFVNKYFPFSDNSILYNFLTYFFIYAITIFISHFSYEYFESVFVRLKDKKYKAL